MNTGASVAVDGTSTESLNSDELRANLRQADPGILVAVLAQLTGDPAVVDRFAAKVSHVPDPPERAGVTDADTLDEIVAAVVAAVGTARPVGALAADDPEVFARIAPVALGGEVGAEYLGLLLEQGGFHPPNRYCRAPPSCPTTSASPSSARASRG